MFVTLPRSTDRFDDRLSPAEWNARADSCANRARAEAEARGATPGDVNEAECIARSQCLSLAQAHENAVAAERTAAARGATAQEIAAAGDEAYARHIAMITEAEAEDAVEQADRAARTAELGIGLAAQAATCGDPDVAAWVIAESRASMTCAAECRVVAEARAKSAARARAAVASAGRALSAASFRRTNKLALPCITPCSRPRGRYRSRRTRRSAAGSSSDGDGGGDPPGKVDRRDQIGCSARVAADQREAVDAISAALADARSRGSDAASLMDFGSSAELSRDPRRSRGAR
jgi:hypothetical protein